MPAIVKQIFMSKDGPVIIIEDDHDDQDILNEALTEIGVQNPIVFFDKGDEALNYLMSTREKPFLILCDINLPGMDGTTLRRKIFEIDYLRKKSIPFIFLTTTARSEAVEEAYRLSVQGYFEKQNHFETLKQRLTLIIDYWQACIHPNGFDSLVSK